mmetsp:Transcript_61649/g.121961  ORF Transcript_61649/g.121961 Transcript_61649/m.121961 type:complete len:169 (-) Transcript_61649:146-652(-)
MPSTVSRGDANLAIQRVVTVASCPDKQLPDVHLLRQRFKQFGMNLVAGASEDKLHKKILMRPETWLGMISYWFYAKCSGIRVWMNPWLAKAAFLIEHVGHFRDVPHILVCIKGGLACDWERQQLQPTGVVAREYATEYILYLKLCQNVEELQHFLESDAPLQECERLA